MRHTRLIAPSHLAGWLGLIILGTMACVAVEQSEFMVKQECMRNGAVVNLRHPRLIWDKQSRMPGWYIVCRYYYYQQGQAPVTWSVGYVYSLRGKGLYITDQPRFEKRSG
jgi:hypothetical protein